MNAKKQQPGIPGQDSVVDELFGALKGGNFFKNRRQNAPTVTAKKT
jgi:hypothetical protein